MDELTGLLDELKILLKKILVKSAELGVDKPDIDSDLWIERVLAEALDAFTTQPKE